MVEENLYLTELISTPPYVLHTQRVGNSLTENRFAPIPDPSDLHFVRWNGNSAPARTAAVMSRGDIFIRTTRTLGTRLYDRARR